MAKGVFITGTDTGIGKTHFTLALMQALKKRGKRVNGMKPIASGAELINGSLINEDAELIMKQCSEQLHYELINPAVYDLPVSPNIAANKSNKIVSLEQISSCYKEIQSKSDNIIVEGVGGWRVPISDDLDISDLVRKLQLPVILVVGLKLGCINHSILTADAIKADGLLLVGWVSNVVEKDYLFIQDTINTLNKSLACPHLADLPFSSNYDLDEVSAHVDVSKFSSFLDL
jgi:dethiobiotin synthetase